MLDFLGVTEHFSCMENTPFSFPALFRDMAGEAVSLDGVIFSGSIVSANQEVIEISIEKGESSNEVIFSFPALPEGRWSYNVLVQADDGSQRILFSGYISVLGVSRVAQLAGGPPMKNRTLLVAMPGEATMRLRMEWMATTAAQAFAYHALQASKNAHADAETASQAAKTATDAAATAATRTEEAEGYAGSAWASKRAAADSAAAADTSATNADRDAKSAHDAKTAVESLAATWPETVSNGEKKIVDAGNEAVTAIQDKQADSVLAVGRASQTAQQNIAGARTDAVAAVQTAQERAVGAITPLVQRAETAKEDIDQAERRINTAATNAATSATSAANSATVAQQALEAIPQVDDAGNMTLAGGLTAAGAINANGGVNIPLAVGAPTDTGAVNRLHAAGMAGVTGILTSNAFLNTDAITASGSSTVTKTVPYHLAGIKVPKGTHSTIQARFEVSNPQWNYSSFAGFSFLWRATNAAKLSFGIGRGGKTIRPDLSIDSYSIIPANGLAYNHGEILDITFDNVRNTDRNGYTVRVREIFALNNTDSWQVKTTTSFVPASQNEPVPWTIAKIIYQQKSVASIARYEDTGALWLMLTGGQGNNLYQIATCRGVSNFETGVGVSKWVTDVVNNAAGDVSVYAGTGEYTYYHPGNVNPVFYGLDAISRNCIETEETADFVDINIPL
ncbi:hypothetical protein [Akkermansia muciniphila]|uniref:hypothetical protein n=1 Tax=Akkermansia muciniphila TaxID=239935 RepID=UPI0027D208F0|nr:hypothetical protein [Akkermansia muciniphila]MCI9266055.1 hypothetical protein [Akkermansia muciniphila]WMB16764.1 hypothetical protein O4G21_07625 [Akkermansia muciniphila]